MTPSNVQAFSPEAAPAAGFAARLKPTVSAKPSKANENPRPGSTGEDFVKAHRIHVEHGSLFIDPYLVVHPRELDPSHEAALRAKMQLTYSIDNPSFFESAERTNIAVNLGKLVPISLGAKRSKLLDEVSRFNTQVDSGADADLQRQAADKREPFTAIVRDTINEPQNDPVGVEVLKNGLSLYLLLREKLTQNHYLNKLSDYVTRANTPDQVLHDLQDNTGISPQAVREAALAGGVDGVGKLLGLDPAYVADVKALSEKAAAHDFSYNMVEHWHLGRQLLGVQAPLEQKLTTGMDARITAKISEYRGRVRHYYDVPEPTKLEEQRIAREDMSVLEPIQRQLMFALGYEICHTPENTADNIAFHKGIYGLHRKAANDLSDIRGTYRIYYSGHGTREKSVGTLAHEVAHNFWPNYFSKEDTQKIDTLAANDQQRFASLQKLLNEKFDDFEHLLKAYQAGSDKEKAAVMTTANEQFASYGITVNGLFPHLVDAKSFRFMVWDANDVLQVEGARYNRSGYDTPQERFREVISRFAEMKQVSHRDNPAVLKFIAPGLTEIWDQHYIPHLERVYQDVVAQKNMRPVEGITGQTYHVPNEPDVQVRSLREELPKVEERITPQAGTSVGTPIHAYAERASERPSTQVFRDSMHIDGNTLAAANALHSMGVNPR